jgi:hypothetical protein
LGVLFTISLDRYEVFIMSEQVYFSFYGRFHIKMFKKACRRGKEPVNLLILGSLSIGVFFCLPQGCQPKLKKSTDLSIKITVRDSFWRKTP